MKLKLLAGAALAGVFAASGAWAEPQGTGPAPSGWYGAIDLGLHNWSTWNTRSSANESDGEPAHLAFHAGTTDFTGFARVGYKLSPHLRIELEGGYRSGQLGAVNDSASRPIGAICHIGGATCGHPSGLIHGLTIMGNVLFDVLPDSPVDPFFGAGAGIINYRVEANGVFSEADGDPLSPAQNFEMSASDNKFAYQGIAGLAFRITDQLSGDLTYRYLGTQDAFLNTHGTGPGGNALELGVINGVVRDQSITVGLRYLFA
ncbi:MAG: outer membrane protein, partial [Caulobacterales bacterium]